MSTFTVKASLWRELIRLVGPIPDEGEKMPHFTMPNFHNLEGYGRWCLVAKDTILHQKSLRSSRCA